MLWKDEQAGHGRRHGERAEDDRAAGGAHRLEEGLGAVPVARRFLAPARDDEERVVDCKTESEAGDEVEREDREGMHLDGDPKAEERERDRARPDEWRQKGGHEPTEDPEREQQDQGEGDQLGATEVILDGLRHLAGCDRAAAEEHLRVLRERGAQPISSTLRRFTPSGMQEHEHDPVTVDDRSRDHGVAVEAGAHPRDRPDTTLHDGEHTRARLDARLPLDLEICEPALRGQIGELVGARIHARDHAAPDREGDRDEGARHQGDEARAGRDQVQHVSREAVAPRVTAQ